MDQREIDKTAMLRVREAIAAGDTLGAVEELVIAFECLEGYVFGDAENGEEG